MNSVVGTDTKYELISILGTGAFGVTFRALVIDNPVRGMSTGDTVAIKVLDGSQIDTLCLLMGVGGDPLNEINRMRDIPSHDYIVGYLDSFTTQDIFYIVVEFCNGGTLESLFNSGNIELYSVIRMWKQLIEGLQFLHSNDIIHLDLKLDNVLLHEDNIKIADFGLARQTFTMQDYIRTFHPGGAIAYRSPEQLIGGLVCITAKCDIWAAGIILVELLLGRRVTHLGILDFSSTTLNVNQGQIVNIVERVRPINNTLADIVEGTLKLDSELRLSSDQIIELLESMNNINEIPQETIEVYETNQIIENLLHRIERLETSLEQNPRVTLLELSTTTDTLATNRTIIWDKIIHNTDPDSFQIDGSDINILKVGYYEITTILIGRVGSILDYYIYSNEVCIINGGHHNHSPQNYHTGCLISCIAVEEIPTAVKVSLYSQCPGIIVNNTEGMHNRLIIKRL